ncbi:MAG: hypothetical protein QM736_26955 [Vicinamibacterales bacterium]
MKDQDASKPHNPSDLKKTDSGRPVYSGGGIEPDRHVTGPIEGFNPTPFGRILYSRQVFATTRRSSPPTMTRVSSDGYWPPVAKRTSKSTRRWWPTSRTFVKPSDTRSTKRPGRRTRVHPAMIRFDIDQALFGMSEARRRLLGADPQARSRCRCSMKPRNCRSGQERQTRRSGGRTGPSNPR